MTLEEIEKQIKKLEEKKLAILTKKADKKGLYLNGCPKVCQWCGKTPMPENENSPSACAYQCRECVKKGKEGVNNLMTIYDKI